MKKCSDIVSPTWTAYPNNPIIDGDSLFAFGNRTEDCPMVKVGNKYYMIKNSGPSADNQPPYMLEADRIFGPWTKKYADPIIAGRTKRVVGNFVYDPVDEMWYIGDIKTTKANFPGGWTEWTQDYPLGASGAWDDYSAGVEIIGKVGSVFIGLAHGKRSGQVTQKYGVTWSHRHNGDWIRTCPYNPIIAPGATGWDANGLYWRSSIILGETLFSFYEGLSTLGVWSVGMSSWLLNGSHGVKDKDNPIIPATAVSGWGAGCDMCANPNAFYEDGVLYLWVDGRQTSGGRWRYSGLFYQVIKEDLLGDLNEV